VYTSQYQYESTSKEFRKQRVAVNAESGANAADGQPMLSRLPAVTTREISPKYMHFHETNSKLKKSQGELSPS